jgi:hypothetical protein
MLLIQAPFIVGENLDGIVPSLNDIFLIPCDDEQIITV